LKYWFVDRNVLAGWMMGWKAVLGRLLRELKTERGGDIHQGIGEFYIRVYKPLKFVYY
jgi:hypothetical protein